MTTSPDPLELDVRACAAEVFGVPVDDVPPDCAYGSLAQWDSVGHVDFLMALDARHAFGLEVAHVSTLTSIPAIVAFLRQRTHG